jgi:copper homeostasis protein CutC
MLLKIVAADGRKDAEEMEKLRVAAEMISIPEDVMHRAFDRYFEETQVLPDEDS